MTKENDNGLEKLAFEYGYEIPLCSIAISLRRIADLLEKEEQHKLEKIAARKDRGERMVNLAT